MMCCKTVQEIASKTCAVGEMDFEGHSRSPEVALYGLYIMSY